MGGERMDWRSRLGLRLRSPVGEALPVGRGMIPEAVRRRAVLLVDSEAGFAPVSQLLRSLGYTVEAVEQLRDPWRAAASAPCGLAIVQCGSEQVPMPNTIGDLSHTIVVRPLGAGRAFDEAASLLGVRAVVGAVTLIPELKALLGDPDSDAPSTAKRLRSVPGITAPPAPDEPERAPAAGQQIAGRYLLVESIEQARVITTFRAQDASLVAPVTLRLARANRRLRGVVERFLDQGHNARQLSHPHIAPIYDFGAWGGLLFTVEEWTTGESLRAALDRRSRGLERPRFLALAQQLCAAITWAHQRGAVHRELEPRGIKLISGNHVRVGGFGQLSLASVPLDGSSDAIDQRLTPYLSPERLRGNESSPQASDVWAVGVILHEAAAGRRPFDGEGLGDLMDAILQGSPQPLSELRPDLPEDARTLIESMLLVDPDKRLPDLRQAASRFGQLGLLTPDAGPF